MKPHKPDTTFEGIMKDPNRRRKFANKYRPFLLSLAKRNEIKQLKKELSILHCWGIRDLEYLPVLGKLLSHKNPEVLRLTLGILLNFQMLSRKKFSQLREYLPVFHKLAHTRKPLNRLGAASQSLALELIVRLSGAKRELVPDLKKYLLWFPEEACDLIVEFGPIAKELVPDLIRLLQVNDWDQILAVIDAIGAIGSDAKEAVPVLEKLTNHKSGVITGRACVALESITGISRKAWPRGPTKLKGIQHGSKRCNR